MVAAIQIVVRESTAGQRRAARGPARNEVRVPARGRSSVQRASVSARPTSPVELGAALETRLLFDGALGGWHGLETLVGDRFAALDRQSVGPGSKSLFGAFDGPNSTRRSSERPSSNPLSDRS